MPNEEPEFGFVIERVLDCGFAIQESINPEEGKMQIGYGMTFLFSADEGWVQFILKANFKNTEVDQLFLTGTALTRFRVNNLISFKKKDNKIHFPDGFLESMFGISFTHLRAFMSKNVAGSRFSHIIVPVINPFTLFKELLDVNVQAFNKLSESQT